MNICRHMHILAGLDYLISRSQERDVITGATASCTDPQRRRRRGKTRHPLLRIFYQKMRATDSARSLRSPGSIFQHDSRCMRHPVVNMVHHASGGYFNYDIMVHSVYYHHYSNTALWYVHIVYYHHFIVCYTLHWLSIIISTILWHT